jgi:hypothetical protein
VNTSSNWNSVILGGTIIACLAVADEPGVPAWVMGELLPAAVGNLVAWSARGWAPDGGWVEGCNYGSYTARYMAPTIAALLSATGSDGGLIAASGGGILASGRLLATMLAPNLQWFDFFDTHDTPECITQYLFFAELAADSAAAYGVRAAALSIAPSLLPNNTGVNAWNAPLALLYFTPLGDAAQYDALPRVTRFQHVQAVAARSSFADPNATFIGFKGRNTTWNWAHTHLDGGSFVWQTQGQWFFQDLGNDNYAVPGYFSPTRFSLYRTGTVGHNGLSFSGANEWCHPLQTYTSNCSMAPLVVYNVTDGRAASAGAGLTVDAFAVVDLTQAYAHISPRIQRVQRGFIVAGGATQLVTVDEVDVTATGAPLPPLWWTGHTVANVTQVTSAEVQLTTWNTTAVVSAVVVDGPGNTVCPAAAWNVTAVSLQPPQFPTPGVSRVSLIAPAETCQRLVVAVGVQPAVGFTVQPLSQWATRWPIANG